MTLARYPTSLVTHVIHGDAVVLVTLLDCHDQLGAYASWLE